MAQSEPEESHQDTTQYFEQLGTHLENIAELMSLYYKSLADKGVPAHLTDVLVKDFNIAIWSHATKKE